MESSLMLNIFLIDKNMSLWFTRNLKSLCAKNLFSTIDWTPLLSKKFKNDQSEKQTWSHAGQDSKQVLNLEMGNQFVGRRSKSS